MARTIEAGTRVEQGFYFSGRSWTLHPVARDGERLPGRAGERYLRVSPVAAMALAPLLGAAFLVFLPFIGFYLVGQAAVRPVTQLFTRSAAALAATLQPGWQPGEAHLTGRAGEAAGSAEAEHDPLVELEREIVALRAARRSS